ncbi:MULTISPECIES: biotin synthase BioB [Streptomyces]|uniref:Biotin synthase n=1 Tax=Streptomyces fradiae ATCC 10745 = DSM 40063 TaxID=1319510 RepID=A0A1Y2NZM9_STRFR|nr:MULTISPECIES: biotin synthase BioB [Streptomyces]KAF0651667.1 biotin synthase [Streptomyces fradiae ATCC 10745 = DSM 40063]OSY52975.1 Biotin synthase [Streptomyces fradiae ATCC 10745 = DSM 40063]QEV11102.1 biotin synthase BioB [Streptomyces fradiae ATCC 10745 = DSM 40063]
MDLLNTLVDKGLRRELPTREEALAVLATSDDELLDVVAAAGRVRRHWFGRRVKLNYLVNLKSGLCPEDCSYCSQRLGSTAGILKYTWLKPDEASQAAAAGIAGGAKRVCLVASGRGPTDRDVDRVSKTIEAIKEDNEGVEVCACLGLLSDGQAERLRAAGADAYNHNLNTSESTYGEITTTHTYADRVDTVRRAHEAGLSACSGLIAGMGESDEDLVDVVFSLRELDPDSVPVNFLIPFEGTPLAKEWNLTPQRALRILAMVRFVCPDVEVRLAGGREVHLRTLQPLALHLANSIFLGDYLTSEGQAGKADLEMIADAGFEVEGAGTTTLPEHRADAAAGGCGTGGGCGSGSGSGGVCGTSEGDGNAAAGAAAAGTAGEAGTAGAAGAAVDAGAADAGAVDASVPGARPDLVAVRRRGAGTDLAPNA